MKRGSPLVLLIAAWLSTPLLGPDYCHGQAPNSPPTNRASSEHRPDCDLTSVAYGNGVFVAAGFRHMILISRGGTNWLDRSTTLQHGTIGVNFTTKTYTAHGQTLTVVIPNEDWPVTGVRPNPFPLRAVASGDNRFVIVGYQGEILFSRTGDQWQMVPAPVPTILARIQSWDGAEFRTVSAPVTATLNGVVWGGQQFVTVGDGGTILTSPDGISWTPRSSGTTHQLLGVAYGRGTFVAVGGDAENSVILTSEDGVRWEPNAMNYLCPVSAIAFGGTEFLASASFHGLAMMSADGRTWREGAPPGYGVRALAYGNRRFVAVHAQSVQPSSSVDGMVWDPPRPRMELGCAFTSVTYGNGLYVGVGRNVLAVSSDGSTWHHVPTPPWRLLVGRRIGDQLFKYAREGWDRAGRLSLSGPDSRLRSKDGETWQVTSGRPISGNVGGDQTLFLMGGKNHEYAVLSSEDGITWTPLRPSQPETALASKTGPAPGVGSTPKPESSNVGINLQLNGQTFNVPRLASAGQVYQLQASTDLEHWLYLTNLTDRGEVWSFVDRDLTNHPMRFYRLKLWE